MSKPVNDPSPRKAQDISALLDELASRANGKDPVAMLMGQRGGLKGGKARAEALSSERRSEIARIAARKRWDKPDV